MHTRKVGPRTIVVAPADFIQESLLGSGGPQVARRGVGGKPGCIWVGRLLVRGCQLAPQPSVQAGTWGHGRQNLGKHLQHFRVSCAEETRKCCYCCYPNWQPSHPYRRAHVDMAAKISGSTCNISKCYVRRTHVNLVIVVTLTGTPAIHTGGHTCTWPPKVSGRTCKGLWTLCIRSCKMQMTLCDVVSRQGGHLGT